MGPGAEGAGGVDAHGGRSRVDAFDAHERRVGAFLELRRRGLLAGQEPRADETDDQDAEDEQRLQHPVPSAGQFVEEGLH
ncbi:MAG: hypothetical protein R3E96_07620 [Planctomycetota bacterium]